MFRLPNATAEREHPAALAQRKILVADQHVTVRTWMREQLSVIGATSVAMAGNAAEMLRMARSTTFDLIICDHHLDQKRDGQQLLEELRCEHLLPLRSVFIIATGERRYGQVVAAAEFAPDDYLIKPYTPHQLSLRLDRALQRKHALRHVFACLEDDDHAGAIAAADHVLQRTPHCALDALRLKAESLVTLGQLEAAAEVYQAVSQTRATPWARMGYAMTLLKQRRIAEARGEAVALNEECPDFLSVYDLLSSIEEESGNHAGALEQIERATRIVTTPDRLRRVAELAETVGDSAKARWALKKALERTRKTAAERVEDHLALVRSLASSGDLLGAEQAMTELKSSFAQDEEAAVAVSVAEAVMARSAGKEESARAHAIKGLDQAQTHLPSGAVGTELAVEAARAGEAGRCGALLSALGDRLNDRLHARLDQVAELKSVVADLFGGVDAADQGARDSAQLLPDTEEDTLVTPPLSGHDAAAESVAAEDAVAQMTAVLDRLQEGWSQALAEEARNALIEAFTVAARDRRVIAGHIRYNDIATRNGGARHSPTVRH